MVQYSLNKPLFNFSGLDAKTLSRIVFTVFTFFIFFGTSTPFGDDIRDVDDISSSNIVSQLIYLPIYAISLFLLYRKRRRVVQFIKEEKFFTLLIAWCFLSVLWSDYSFVTFKRWMKLFGSSAACLAFLLHLDSVDEALKYFKIILGIYIPLTLISVAVVPEAIQWEFPAWRGLAPHKNHLGQISLLSVIVWASAFKRDVGFRAKCISGAYLAASIVILIGAQSSTSLIVFLFITALFALLATEKLFSPPGMGRYFSVLLASCFAFAYLMIQMFYPETFEMILGQFGKDATFTGRTELWAEVLDEAFAHPLVGAGFGGFWVVGNPPVMSLYEDPRFIWLPNQAHSGYIDFLNETGIVGVILLIGMILTFFVKLRHYPGAFAWKWFFVSALILNVQETCLFLDNPATGIMYVFAYLILIVSLVQNKPLLQQRETVGIFSPQPIKS